MSVLYYAKVATQGGALNLRSSAKKVDNIMCEIPFGAEVAVLDNSNKEWTQVSYNGRTGFVSSSYLSYAYNAPPYVSADDEASNDVVLKENDSWLGGTWGVFIPCSSKSAATELAGYFSGGKALKADLGD